MTTTPTTSPHLAPTSPPPAGATSCSDLAPTPLPLRGGAMSRGDLGHQQNNPTTSPQGRGQIRATCPTHGPTTFTRDEPCNLWICTADPPAACLHAILDEHLTPDGAHIIDLRTEFGFEVDWHPLFDWLLDRHRQAARS